MNAYPVSRSNNPFDELYALAAMLEFLASAGQHLITAETASEGDAEGFYYTARFCTESLRKIAESDFDKAQLAR